MNLSCDPLDNYHDSCNCAIKILDPHLHQSCAALAKNLGRLVNFIGCCASLLVDGGGQRMR